MIADALLAKVATGAAIGAIVLSVVLGVRLAVVQQNLDACNKDRSELSGKLELQGQELDDWKTAWQVAQEKGAAAAARARQASEAGRVRGEQLQAQILAGAAKDCASAMPELRKGWQ